MCLKAHSQSPGGRGGESVGDGSDDSGQIVLDCHIRHIVGQVVASVRPGRQRQEQSSSIRDCVLGHCHELCNFKVLIVCTTYCRYHRRNK